MAEVTRFELMKVDFPLRKPFRHAAAIRRASESIFVKCVTDRSVGFGESLPRQYVTGETRDAAFALLERHILPRLIGVQFNAMDSLSDFLVTCDGKAPPEWIAPNRPQGAAWCAVELSLLDAFSRALHAPIQVPAKMPPFRYSGAISADNHWRFTASLLKQKLFGFKEIKLKVGKNDPLTHARWARRIMGKDCLLRVDANMAWTAAEALNHIQALDRVAIHCIEQPLAAGDWKGAARLVRETQATIIADESFADRASLERLLNQRACRGVNVRISKCGGLVAARRRCEEALKAGLTVQIGCKVGESSLLSAAQLMLIASVNGARHFEGCYGRHLLPEDPGQPCLQLGYGGRPPQAPGGPGWGIELDEAGLNRWVSQRVTLGNATTKQGRELCPSQQN